MKSLDEIKKENPFLVPDGYFDQLESEVMSKVRMEQKKIHRRRIYTISVAVAAVAALLIAINVWIFVPENNGQNTELAEEGTPTVRNFPLWISKPATLTMWITRS